MKPILSLLVISVALVGCKNPGAEVTPATVEAAPEAEAKAAPSATVATLPINPSNSKVEFIGAKVTASHPGGFTDFSGKLELAAPVEQCQIQSTIETASLFAAKEKLTTHRKSADFFDGEKYPNAEVRSTEIQKEREGHVITGDLTLHGVTKRSSFPATVAVSDAQVQASSEFSINRKDFGINYPGMQDDLIRDLVVIKLSLALPRQG